MVEIPAWNYSNVILLWFKIAVIDTFEIILPAQALLDNFNELNEDCSCFQYPPTRGFYSEQNKQTKCKAFFHQLLKY